MTDRTELEPRMILYIDLLGFSEFIQKMKMKSKEENARTVGILTLTFPQVLEAARRADNPANSRPYDMQLFHFSDTIVVSMSHRARGRAFEVMVKAANVIAARMLDIGLLCRGAIHFGQLYHKDNLIYGPALVEAHAHESKCAFYPRIIVTRDMYSSIHQRYEDMGLLRDIGLKHDNDFHYVDFIGHLKKEILAHKPMKAWCLYCMRDLHKIIEEGLAHPKPEVRQKFEWMANRYLEQAVELHKESAHIPGIWITFIPPGFDGLSVPAPPTFD